MLCIVYFFTSKHFQKLIFPSQHRGPDEWQPFPAQSPRRRSLATPATTIAPPRDTGERDRLSRRPPDATALCHHASPYEGGTAQHPHAPLPFHTDPQCGRTPPPHRPHIAAASGGIKQPPTHKHLLVRVFKQQPPPLKWNSPASSSGM